MMSEVVHDALFAQAPISLVQVGLDGTVLAVNQTVVRISGYSEAEIVGRSFLEFVHPGDRTAAAADLGRLAAGAVDAYEAERRYILRPGTELFVLERVVVVRPPAPAPPYCLSALHDLTRHRQLTETLRANEARLHLALSAGQMGAWDWDLVTGGWVPSPELARLHGVSVEDFGGDYVERYVHPADRERVRQAIEEGLRDRVGHAVEYRILLPDGSERWLLAKGRPSLDDRGRVVRLSGVCADVTARKVDELRDRALSETSAVLATVLDHRGALAVLANLVVPDFADWCAVDIVGDDGLERLAVAHRDPDKVALAVEVGRRWPPGRDARSGAAELVRTRQPVLVPHLTPEMLAGGAQDPEHLEALRALHLRSVIGVPLTARDRVLGVLWLMMAESGRIYGREDLAFAEELASRAATAVDNARLYQESQAAVRAKDEFLARVSHELRTPLNAISGWTRVLRDREESEAGRRALDVVIRNVQSLSRLIEDLLDFSRHARHEVYLRRQRVDLADLCRAALVSFQPLAAERRIALHAESAGECQVLGDPDRLQQVLGNLLSNAIKATPDGGRISLDVRRHAEGIQLTVRDTGEGIPAGELDAIFEPFRQVRRRGSSGLGLGLAIAREIVGAHGGSIHACSEGSGTGASFVVWLPPAP